MKKLIIACLLALVCFSSPAAAQIQKNTLVQIVKAEDERRFDKTLADLLKNSGADVRRRAALAAGRIGNEAAIETLARLAETDADEQVRVTSVFALGEIESVKGAEAILKILSEKETPDAVCARAVEAAGKIAAANANDEKAAVLKAAILDALEFESERGQNQSRDIILLGLTAVLRARPEGGDLAAGRFLQSTDARVRIDAANTLTRIRSKNFNPQLRAMLQSDRDPVARANAARALGAAEDKEAFDLLLKAATDDTDARVRVSAVRSVAALKDERAAEKLLARGALLLADFKKSKSAAPAEKSELLEIAAALGRIAPNAGKEKAVTFLNDLRTADKLSSPETEIAFARVAPKIYVDWAANEIGNLFGGNWRASSAVFQAFGEIANLPSSAENDALKSRVRVMLVQLIAAWTDAESKRTVTEGMRLAAPDLVRAFAAFKSENAAGIFRLILELEPEPMIRAALAEALGEQSASKENVEALKKAFSAAYLADKIYNDAQLAILDALFKLDKKEAVGSLLMALDAPDFLVRKKSFELLGDRDLQKDFPGIRTSLENARAKNKDKVLSYSPVYGTKLGQILNANADYLRAVSRRNGTVKAVLTTEKGAFTVDLTPEDAPLTVDNFIKLARAGYFNNVAVHRVVPNFVMQDGDPRGDGNGGPGWSIRCEVNLLEYARGAVGMALSGKDTGGSQWFVTHSPQPHLDGGYTIFGKVNEVEMKVVDAIVRGDRIMSVKIIESAPKTQVKAKTKAKR